MDAPHTGARLETTAVRFINIGSPMPPTRGHDLKLNRRRLGSFSKRMPPTRGHDLKHPRLAPNVDEGGCPPHGGTT